MVGQMIEGTKTSGGPCMIWEPVFMSITISLAGPKTWLQVRSIGEGPGQAVTGLISAWIGPWNRRCESSQRVQYLVLRHPPYNN